MLPVALLVDSLVKSCMKLNFPLTLIMHLNNQFTKMNGNKKGSYYFINLFALTYITLL